VINTNFSVGASLNESPRTTTIGPQFSVDLFESSSSWTTTFIPFPASFSHVIVIYMDPLCSHFLVWSFPYSNLYGLSLLIRPFQGPLYTAIGPFSWCPRCGGLRVVCVSSEKRTFSNCFQVIADCWSTCSCDKLCLLNALGRCDSLNTRLQKLASGNCGRQVIVQWKLLLLLLLNLNVMTTL